MSRLTALILACAWGGMVACSAPHTTMMSPPSPQPLQVLEDTAPNGVENSWMVDADQAIALIRQGATVLDAQGPGLGTRRLSGATPVQWQQFSRRDNPFRGHLLDDDAQLTRQLQALGIDGDRPVVVFANPPSGWGEDGRIVWMLRTLGHTHAVMVDGGIRALLQAGVRSQTIQSPSVPGTFVVERSPLWLVSQTELRRQLDHTAAELPTIIDTREQREYNGATPYGEQRGGHVPGAVHLYFKDLMDDTGHVYPPEDLRRILQIHGITTDRPVVVYCTGGIRSAWLATVLISHGFSVQNYAGSMWEWSAAPTPPYPLEVH